MVVRRQKIIVNGKEMEIDVFDTAIKPGELDDNTADALMEEEEIEKEIRSAIEKIKEVRGHYESIEKNLEYYHEAGGKLQFIDKFTDRYGNRTRILNRMATDLAPELFFGNPELKREGAKPELESRREIERMYLLGKFKREDLSKATWVQWDEIFKFKGLSGQRTILKKVFELCKNGMTSVKLREAIDKLRESAA